MQVTTVVVMTPFRSFTKFQNLTLLIHQTNVGKYTLLNPFMVDFRNYLVSFRPCISQCTSFN